MRFLRRPSCILALFAGSLVVVGWLHRSELDPDMLSYILACRHYVRGEFGLAINGYWGPMLSWLMIPLALAGVGEMAAAQIAMGATSIFFVAACVRLFRACGLGEGRVALLSALAALHLSGWNFVIVAPDPLVAGLLILGCARLIGEDRVDPRALLATGAIFGLGYLAKAVAFPVTLLIVPLFFALRWRLGLLAPAAAARAAAVALAGFFAVALPWMILLSVHYGRPTFSTTARAAHTIVGPSPPDRFHPTWMIFHRPEPGRLNSWEDPTYLPYLHWSPLESRANLLFQAKFIKENIVVILSGMAKGDLLGLGFFALIAAILAHAPWLEGMRRDRWRWSIVAVLPMVAPYLPVYAKDARYYFCAYPFMLMCSAQVLDIAPAGERSDRLRRLAALGVLLVSFGLPGVHNLAASLAPSGWQTHSANQRIALRLKEIGAAGPISGATPDNFGLTTSYYLDEPYLGQKAGASKEELLQSGAKLFYVPDKGPLAEELHADPRFRDLAADLAGEADQLSALRIRLFARAD